MRTQWIAQRTNDQVITQLHYARRGIVTEEMRAVARDEQLAVELVLSEIATGRMIIPANIKHPHCRPVAIGRAARCKINANIGNSALASGADDELAKLETAITYGADAGMDLSTGDDLDGIRARIIAASPAPVGTVPIYEAAQRFDRIEDMPPAFLLDVIEKHATQGVDFITVHCGLLKRHVQLAVQRVTGIVSRGGALTARWMTARDEENPLYTHFDELLAICRRYDLALSLGDGLRPGSLADASDAAQFAELDVLGELTRRARAAEVQVMVEGPGHIPFDQIEMNIRRQIDVCDGAPFYVLGPLVTDIAAGYDHITSAIGGTMAAYCGASMLCYVTPREHLGLPTLEDVRAGVVAHKIAAHAADIALKRPGSRDRDDRLSRARFALDWQQQFAELLDPHRAREYYAPSSTAADTSSPPHEACTMCGPKFCAMKISRELRECPKTQKQDEC
jgi:phosphomethylpyrimidine synthase